MAAISVHLLSSDGAEIHVNEPISVSIPLPANSGLKENDHIPAWRFDPKLGRFYFCVCICVCLSSKLFFGIRLAFPPLGDLL